MYVEYLFNTINAFIFGAKLMIILPSGRIVKSLWSKSLCISKYIIKLVPLNFVNKIIVYIPGLIQVYTAVDKQYTPCLTGQP